MSAEPATPATTDVLRKCPRCPEPAPLDDEHFYRRADGREGGFHRYCKTHHLAVKKESRRRSALAAGPDGKPDVHAVLRVIAYGRDGIDVVRQLAASTLREVQANARRA